MWHFFPPKGVNHVFSWLLWIEYVEDSVVVQKSLLQLLQCVVFLKISKNTQPVSQQKLIHYQDTTCLEIKVARLLIRSLLSPCTIRYSPLCNSFSAQRCSVFSLFLCTLALCTVVLHRVPGQTALYSSLFRLYTGVTKTHFTWKRLCSLCGSGIQPLPLLSLPLPSPHIYPSLLSTPSLTHAYRPLIPPSLPPLCSLLLPLSPTPCSLSPFSLLQPPHSISSLTLSYSTIHSSQFSIPPSLPC